jgi:hypothetical protein
MKSFIALIMSTLIFTVSVDANATRNRFKYRNKIKHQSIHGNAKFTANNHSQLNYKPPPDQAPKAFPNLRSVKRKTLVQGGQAKRKRWKDNDGNIFEWDSRHGTLEKYNNNGVHMGEFDPDSGVQLKQKNKSMRITP